MLKAKPLTPRVGETPISGVVYLPEPSTRGDPFLGKPDLGLMAAMAGPRWRFDDSTGAVGPPSDSDWAQALLDAAGVPPLSLRRRILWVAERWLAIAAANRHPPGCQCGQCASSRKIVAENYRISLR